MVRSHLFSRPVEEKSKPVAVATGNWGCGAFKGDPQLKSLIQLMAASLCRRDVVYFTFDNQKLCRDIRSTYQKLLQCHITVGQLYKMLIEYGENTHNKNFRMTVFEYLESFSLASQSTNKKLRMDETHRQKPSPEKSTPGKSDFSYADAAKGKSSMGRSPK